MAAIEMFPDEVVEIVSPRPALRLVPSPVQTPRQFRTGTPVAQRLQARERMMQRRRRTIAVAAVSLAFLGLGLQGLAGGTTPTGLSASMEGVSNLTPGMVYVVQSGDTLASIAAQVNPLNEHEAFKALASELRSTSIIPGEHILIP